MYVVGVDVKGNTITVSSDKADAAVKEALVADMHWIGNEVEGEVEVQTRYREKVVQAVAKKAGKEWRFEFAEPHIAAPGQSLVAYKGEQCLGGGPVTLGL
jgi:tRNA U34 2-thiouridine synthase MnmA/TrmU